MKVEGGGSSFISALYITISPPSLSPWRSNTRKHKIGTSRFLRRKDSLLFNIQPHLDHVHVHVHVALKESNWSDYYTPEKIFSLDWNLPSLGTPYSSRFISIHLDSSTLRLLSSQVKSIRAQCSFAQPRLSCEASRSSFSSPSIVRVHNNSDRHHRPHPSGISARTGFFSSFCRGRWGPSLDLFGLAIFCLVGIYSISLRCCFSQHLRPPKGEKIQRKFSSALVNFASPWDLEYRLDFISICDALLTCFSNSNRT